MQNRLLSSLSTADYAVLRPHLILVDLPKAHELIVPERRIDYCWFMEDGIASLVATSSRGQEAEAGIVGRDGMVDLATILGADRSPLRCFIQVPGYGYRLPAAILRSRMTESGQMRSLLLHHVHQCFVDVAQTALANASFTVEERLARWLLMCADRLGRNDIALTHDFLAVMLNVRRPGVTLALQSMRAAGLLKTSRGVITIIDALRLQTLAREAYRPVTI